MKRLIIFTRYPESGKAKTRLIPALGAEAAAELHRQMTEHTILQARLQPSTIEIWFTGGNLALMQSWLGTDLLYQPQLQGDLGERMAQAFESTFNRNVNAAIIIGTDCPDLDCQLLAQAFEQLQQIDIVLGPATDGGYYLIGLRQFVPDLFKTIAWSTNQVLQQTIEIAHRLNLSYFFLPTLSDVDRPEDLPIWQAAKRVV